MTPPQLQEMNGDRPRRLKNGWVVYFENRGRSWARSVTGSYRDAKDAAYRLAYEPGTRWWIEPREN